MESRNFFRLFLIVTVCNGFFTWQTTAQSVTGDWHGMITVQDIPIRIDLHLSEENGKLTGTWDSPDQGQTGLTFSKVSLDQNTFRFTFDPADLTYEGVVNKEFSVITGIFEQGSLYDTLSFRREMPAISENSAEYFKQLYEKQEVYIPMRDGIRLFTSVYSPRKMDKPAPVIMIRTPYNAEPGGEKEFNFTVLAISRFLKEGYILVFQDVRGRYMSEGTFVNVRPFFPDKTGTQTDEASDTWDTADWLVKNVKNNNGRIGVAGVSYPGFYATMAILAGHPAIKAVSPQAPVTNWFIGDDEHHNGAFFLLDNFSFHTWFNDPMNVPTRKSDKNFTWNSEDSYDFFLRLGPIKNTGKFLSDSVKYWHEVFEHPDYDSWWKATDPRPYLTGVKPAVMTVGGWFDAEDLWGTLHTYQAIEHQNSPETKNFLVMGPWEHGQWALTGGTNMGNIYWGSATSDYYHQKEVSFFNHYLKNTNAETEPEATVFITGSNKWQEFASWPPKNTETQTLWFLPGGKLDFSPSSLTKGYDAYISDPAKPVPYREDVHLFRDPDYMTDDQRFAARRPDVLVYQTGILAEDITLTGPLTAELYVSLSGTDADFVVKLIDVFPDTVKKPDGSEIEVPLGGYQMLVRGEIMRGKYRNSFENPEPFKPGKVTKVQFELPDVAHTFKTGHRIMVQIQSSWFPLVDRNPQVFTNIYTCDESDFRKAVIRVYHNRQNGSRITVRRLKTD